MGESIRTFADFYDATRDLTISERLERAEVMWEYLTIELQSVDSTGGDGKNIHQDLKALEGLINYLRKKVAYQSCGVMVQMRIMRDDLQNF